MEKWPFFDQNDGLTPLEKSQFFDFLNFLFLQARKAFFRSRISQNTFSWLILPKEKRWKNGHFLTKTMGNPFGKISIFLHFLNFLFLLPRKVFFWFKNIVKHIFLACIAQKYILLLFQMDTKVLQSIKMLFEKRKKLNFFKGVGPRFLSKIRIFPWFFFRKNQP